MASLEGKVAMVTGASSGIGEGIAVLLAERGASVVLCSRDHDRLREASDKCKAVSGHKDRFLSLAGDLVKSEVRKKLVEEAVKRFGKLDILVANAGCVGCLGGIEKETEENFDRMFDTNVKAVYFLVQQAVPHLAETKGCVVVTSSIVSEICSGPLAIYCASKAAVDHLVKCLSLELASKDIRINSINPTFVTTRLFNDMFPQDERLEQSVEAMLAPKDEVHPLKGRRGTVQEMARAAAFLVSDDAGYITGQNLHVDGGVMRRFTVLPE